MKRQRHLTGVVLSLAVCAGAAGAESVQELDLRSDPAAAGDFRVALCLHAGEGAQGAYALAAWFKEGKFEKAYGLYPKEATPSVGAVEAAVVERLRKDDLSEKTETFILRVEPERYQASLDALKRFEGKTIAPEAIAGEAENVIHAVVKELGPLKMPYRRGLQPPNVVNYLTDLRRLNRPK